MRSEKIEQHIRELEAIKNYDKVKNDINQLIQTNKELNGKLRKLSKEKNNLENALNEKEQEAKRLREELKVKNEEKQKSELVTTRLNNRVEELENLKTIIEGKTFREAEKALLKAMDNEIDTRADEAFKLMKTKWDTSDKPKEIFNEALKQLENIINTLRNPQAHYFSKALIDKKLPKKVEEIIKADVEKRLNKEFQKQVESKSDQKAYEKLIYLKNEEWPKWFKTNVDPRARELETKIVADALNQLKGPWIITCDKCNTKLNAEFTNQQVADLLRNRYIILECINPNCRDFFSRHRMRTTLETLISILLSH